MGRDHTYKKMLTDHLHASQKGMIRLRSLMIILEQMDFKNLSLVLTWIEEMNHLIEDYPEIIKSSDYDLIIQKLKKYSYFAAYSINIFDENRPIEFAKYIIEHALDAFSKKQSFDPKLKEALVSWKKKHSFLY